MKKTKINNLGNVLKKCVFNKAKLEDILFKKNSSKRQVHTTHAHTSKSHTKHTHVPHAHHAYHAFMYGKIYTCAYCGRKGHLAKFYFDPINASDNHISVRKGSNPHGPNKIWVPKLTPILFDVGVALTRRERYWCLDGGCVPN